MARITQPIHHIRTQNQMNLNQILRGQSTGGELNCDSNLQTNNNPSDIMMFNNHQMTNYRLSGGSMIQNVAFNNQIHSTAGYVSSNYSNSPEVSSTTNNQQQHSNSFSNSLNHSTNLVMTNLQNSSLDDFQNDVNHTLQTNPNQLSSQTNFSNNQLLQLTNQQNVPDNLPQIPMSNQQNMFSNRFIKREIDLDNIAQQPQHHQFMHHSTQQMPLLNNNANTGELVQSNNSYTNVSYSVDNEINRDQNLYKVQNNLPIMNNQLTNQMQVNNQYRFGEFTNSQLAEHLNNSKNQLVIGLQQNIHHHNTMTNMIGNEIQLQNGIIIRPTFNNGLAAFQPINMEDQERYKQERKRQRNREAATKCRLKKIEKVRQLKLNAELLDKEVENLGKVANDSRVQVNKLKYQIMTHINNGCLIAVKSMNESSLDDQFIVDDANDKSQLKTEANVNLLGENHQNNIISNQINVIKEEHLYEHNYTDFPLINAQVDDSNFQNNYQREDRMIQQNYVNNQLTPVSNNKNLIYSNANQVN